MSYFGNIECNIFCHFDTAKLDPRVDLTPEDFSSSWSLCAVSFCVVAIVSVPTPDIRVKGESCKSRLLQSLVKSNYVQTIIKPFCIGRMRFNKGGFGVQISFQNIFHTSD